MPTRSTSWSTIAKSGSLAVLVAFLPACASFSNLYSSWFEEKNTVSGIDNLLSWIERVHVDTELAKEHAGEALDRLHELVSPDFSGDPLKAFPEFVAAIETSEKQSKSLSRNIDKVRKAAQSVFDTWARDLEGFTSTEMRLRSHERLDKTKERYRAMIVSIEPANDDLVEFNKALRDHAFFLGNDFNQAAIESIEPELRGLGIQASELARSLQEALDAAQTYIDTTSMPGVIVPEEQGESTKDGPGPPPA